MSTHHVLKGNQYAGLPQLSTFEPLRIINELIQDANEKQNELYKTYPRRMIE